MRKATDKPRKSGPSPARTRTADWLIAIIVLASLVLVGTATMTTRSDSRQTSQPDPAITDAVTTLRQTFGYDGIVHELDRLRRNGDPAALAAMGDSLRSARGAIGTLRKRLPDAQPAVGRALGQLESAARRLESLLRSDQGDLSARIVDLPLLEPLFVLDEAIETLRDAVVQDNADSVHDMLWLTVAAGCLLAATALLLAGWVRVSLLSPLRELASDLAKGTQGSIERLTLRADEFGTIARRLAGKPLPTTVATPEGMPALLRDQGELLVQIRDLVQALPSKPNDTNEPENQAVIQPEQAAARTNEPEPETESTNEPGHGIALFAKSTNEPEQPRSTVLHSIVELVAKEQVRRHAGAKVDPAAPATENDRLMSELVDRVLTRLDQVTERVTVKTDEAARRAS